MPLLGLRPGRNGPFGAAVNERLLFVASAFIAGDTAASDGVNRPQ